MCYIANRETQHIVLHKRETQFTQSVNYENKKTKRYNEKLQSKTRAKTKEET